MFHDVAKLFGIEDQPWYVKFVFYVAVALAVGIVYYSVKLLGLAIIWLIKLTIKLLMMPFKKRTPAVVAAQGVSCEMGVSQSNH